MTIKPGDRECVWKALLMTESVCGKGLGVVDDRGWKVMECVWKALLMTERVESDWVLLMTERVCVESVVDDGGCVESE